MRIKVLNDQSLMDICIQMYGSIDMLERLAEDNGLSVDERIENGSYLSINPALVADDRIRSLYRSNGLKPATEYRDEPPGPFTIEFDNIFFNSSIHSTD